jgi:hypothetical protein
MRAGRFLLLLIGAAAVMSACSSGVTPLAIVASNSASIGTGEQRILFAMVDPETNGYLASEDAAATAVLRDEDGTPLGTYDLEFVWTVPEVRGIYAGYFDIPGPGVYQVSVEQEGLAESGPTGFVAADDPPMVGPGESALLSETRTAADVSDLSLITTDPDPDPEMYSMTVAEAVSNGRPAVLVFATPGFCTTQSCGPMLDQVKELRPDYPEVDFVHVEIYDDLQVENVEELVLVDAVVDWQIPSEPWVYIVDEEGTVVAAFEGAVNEDELTAVLDGFGEQ